MGRLLCGVGLCDVDYVVQKKETIGYVNGKRKQVLIWECPYYSKWRDMVVRCYSKKLHNRYPTYIGCTIQPDWLHLGNFIKWVDSQPNRDWVDCSLDKDFLVQGNKIYSPDTCVFISSGLNNFITDRCSSRGKYLTGVCWQKNASKFVANCSDPFKTDKMYIGLFDSEIEAHLAWKAKKYEYACRLADLQTDRRVAEVLRTRYKP